jgi:serine/threonine protein kinase
MEKKQIGKYTIVGKVGAGAMGEVFKAHDPVLNRYVAVKTIVSSLDQHDDLRQRFQREAQSAAQLNHPNIVSVYDFGEDEGQIFMAMELLEGSDLREIIRARRLLTLEEKLRLMEQVCDGLGFAHAKGIVHRDLKPGNIHVLPSKQVKLMDFGLARLASSDMTKSGLILGTPNYMSPEQVQGKRVDARSDVFSLGAVFYELLSYQKPFAAESIHATMFKVVQCERDPLTKWVPDLPRPVVDLIDKALQKEPTNRFQNADEIREALRVLRQEIGNATGSVLSNWSPDLQETVVAAASDSAPSSPSGARSGSSGRQVRTLRGSQVAGSRAGGEGTIRWVGIGLAIAALVAGGYWLLSGKSADNPGGSSAEIDALSQALVQSQLELAATNLEAKQYSAALAQAERVLSNDPLNAEALRIQDEVQSVLSELDAAVAEARDALARSQPEEAATALDKVLSIDSSHPLAGELSAQLNSHFRSRAEAARAEVSRARQEAEAAGAASLREFQNADRIAAESERDFNQGQFAMAAQKLMQARDGFAQAGRSARERAAAESQVTSAARTETEALSREWASLLQENGDASTRRQPAFRTASSQASEAERLAAGQDYSAASRAYRQAIAGILEAKEQALRDQARGAQQAQQVQEARQTERARAAAAPPPAATTPPATATPAPAAPQVNQDEEAIRRVIAEYARAIESKDIELFATVKPNLSRDERGRLEASFRAVDSTGIDIDITSIEIQGPGATVRLNRRDTISAGGDQQTHQSEQIMVLAKGPNGWVIEQISQAR